MNFRRLEVHRELCELAMMKILVNCRIDRILVGPEIGRPRSVRIVAAHEGRMISSKSVRSSVVHPMDHRPAQAVKTGEGVLGVEGARFAPGQRILHGYRTDGQIRSKSVGVGASDEGALAIVCNDDGLPELGHPFGEPARLTQVDPGREVVDELVAQIRIRVFTSPAARLPRVGLSPESDGFAADIEVDGGGGAGEIVLEVPHAGEHDHPDALRLTRGPTGAPSCLQQGGPGALESDARLDGVGLAQISEEIEVIGLQSPPRVLLGARCRWSPCTAEENRYTEKAEPPKLRSPRHGA